MKNKRNEENCMVSFVLLTHVLDIVCKRSDATCFYCADCGVLVNFVLSSFMTVLCTGQVLLLVRVQLNCTM